jgi:hypothetical protein
MLLDIVNQAFHVRAWHGTTLRGALRGLTVQQAIWKPAPDRHCIWDLILHTAYWKYIVSRRLSGDRSRRFPRSPSNWPSVPQDPTARQLRADVQLLEDEHARLVEAIASLEPTRLNRRSQGSKWRDADLTHGIAAHDLYHAGQIQLLKRLQP